MCAFPARRRAARQGPRRRGAAARSGDAGRYADVIARSNEASAYGDLVKFLLMVRKKVKDPQARARPAARPAAAAGSGGLFWCASSDALYAAIGA